VILSVLFV